VAVAGRVLKIGRDPMTERITLIVRFRVEPGSKAEFINGLKEVFRNIERESTFVEASLLEDFQDSRSMMVYEVWEETPDSFMKNQMTKPYRAGYEKALVALKVERTANWYQSLAAWKSQGA
jgi:quinol monooxygenase YgiN